MIFAYRINWFFFVARGAFPLLFWLLSFYAPERFLSEHLYHILRMVDDSCTQNILISTVARFLLLIHSTTFWIISERRSHYRYIDFVLEFWWHTHVTQLSCILSPFKLCHTDSMVHIFITTSSFADYRAKIYLKLVHSLNN